MAPGCQAKSQKAREDFPQESVQPWERMEPDGGHPRRGTSSQQTTLVWCRQQSSSPQLATNLSGASPGRAADVLHLSRHQRWAFSLCSACSGEEEMIQWARRAIVFYFPPPAAHCGSTAAYFSFCFRKMSSTLSPTCPDTNFTSPSRDKWKSAQWKI